MSRKYDVMVAGHLCIDFIPKFPNNGIWQIEKILAPGKLVNVHEMKISTGGPVSNTGINMKTLGNKVCFCACTGDDLIGEVIINILKVSGNSDGIRIMRGESSSYTIVVSPPGIDRIFLHNPGTNDLFGSENLDSNLISKCRHFHFGYPPLMKRLYSDEGTELERIFKIAKDVGTSTSCDMTLPDPVSESGRAPWRRILERILPYVDIFLPSIEETFFMLKPTEFVIRKECCGNGELIDHISPEEYSAIAQEVLEMGAGAVSLKSGHRGFYIRTASKSRLKEFATIDTENWADRELWTQAFKVDKFGSATGSGDSSIAGFLSAYLRGLTIEEALKYATCCGLQNVRVMDAISGIKPWDQTTAMLRQDLTLIDAHINSKGWKWLSENRLWSGPNDKMNLSLENKN